MLTCMASVSKPTALAKEHLSARSMPGGLAGRLPSSQARRHCPQVHLPVERGYPEGTWPGLGAADRAPARTCGGSLLPGHTGESRG